MLAHASCLAAPDDPETAKLLIQTVTYQAAGRRLPSPVVSEAIRLMGDLGRTKPALQPLFAPALREIVIDADSWPRYAADELRQAANAALAQFDAVPEPVAAW